MERKRDFKILKETCERLDENALFSTSVDENENSISCSVSLFDKKRVWYQKEGKMKLIDGVSEDIVRVDTPMTSTKMKGVIGLEDFGNDVTEVVTDDGRITFGDWSRGD